MSLYANSRVMGSCDNLGVRQYSCQSHGGQSQNSVPKCQMLKPRDLRKCLDGATRIFKARDTISQTSKLNSVDPPPTTNNNTEKVLLPAANIDRSSSSEISLAAPFIAVIIISIIVSLVFLFLLIRRGREAKHVENSIEKKEKLEMDRSPSQESSCLNHHRVGSEVLGQCSISSAGTASPIPQDDAPIPDLEKGFIIEPPIDTHPAYKYFYNANPNPPMENFKIPPSPLLSSMCHATKSPRQKLSAKTEYMSSETEPLTRDSKPSGILISGYKKIVDQEINNHDSYGHAKSDLDFTKSTPTPQDCLVNRNRSNGEADGSQIQVNCLESGQKSETARFLEVDHNSDYSLEKLSLDITQDAKSGFRTKNDQEGLYKFDSNDRVHVISDRWSGSTLNSEFPSINMLSDWNIPGAWKSYTCLNEDDTCASRGTTLGPDFDGKKSYDSESESDSDDDEACTFDIDLNDH